jgi:hypothetical protein
VRNLRAVVAEAPLIGFDCRPALEGRVSLVGRWTEQAHGEHFLVICRTRADLTTARNLLGSEAREAIALGPSGLWIEAVPTI